MTSLLSQCLHNSRSSKSRTYAVVLFHSSASVTRGQGMATKSKKSTIPPKPAFAREELPHVGKEPRAERSAPRRPRDRDAHSRTGGYTPNRPDTRPRRDASVSYPKSRSPLASPHTVASRTGDRRLDIPRGGFRTKEESRRETRTGHAAYRNQPEFSRPTDGPSRTLTFRGGFRSQEQSTRGRNSRDGDGGIAKQPAFSRSHEGPSRQRTFEPRRDSNQPRRVVYDNEADFSVKSRARETPSSSGGPWKASDAASYAVDTQEAPREFSRDDKPLNAGAYDEPQLQDEFYHPLEPVSSLSAKGKRRSASTAAALPITSFESPPLLPGFVTALKEMLGPTATPTPIQSLSMKHLLDNDSTPVPSAPGWRQFLLASETGSGKSIAYLLPLLQHVKQSELAAHENPSSTTPGPQRLLNPRGLIMAPTHELARQLAVFAKALLHDVKLRVWCASRANTRNSPQPHERHTSPARMYRVFAEDADREPGAQEVPRGGHPVGVVVGTPMKLLEMVRGRGWDAVEESEAMARAEEEMERESEGDEDGEGATARKIRRGRDKVVHFGKWRSKPELGLANVEWVVVDEADVLFDPDFQETTRTLLADISAARGQILPPSASALPTPVPSPSPLSGSTPSNHVSPTASDALDYPFNLVLTSATIPKTLNGYLERYHPAMLRLASPRLHRLPKTLQTEYVGWTGGNKFADVMRRIRRVWAEDAASSSGGGSASEAKLSKVLVFCNKSAKVVEFAAYLAENGIKSVAMTSQSEHRGRGSNSHLQGFLKEAHGWPSSTSTNSTAVTTAPSSNVIDVKNDAHVMITTSLLSRGLDFSPAIKHVFIVDEPRNTIDFLHRAGRTGRAGERGKVVIFGKMTGRGSARAKEVRKRVGVLSKA